jgi:hypothetical protein
MKAFVDLLSASKCVAALGDRERTRLAFDAATALRDYAEIARVADILLAAKRGWPPADFAGYLRGGVTARLALGQPAEARALWQRHYGTVSPEERNLLITRLVGAHLPGNAHPSPSTLP